LNNYGQCGVGSRDTVLVPTLIPAFYGKRVLSITGGVHHTLALDADGTVYSWGRCHYGRLGLGGGTGEVRKWTEEDDRLIPTIISSLSPTTIKDRVVAIAAGESHSLAVTRGGGLYAWGFNELAQLGLGHDEDIHTPLKCQGKQIEGRQVLCASAGSQHSIALARPNIAASPKNSAGEEPIHPGEGN
jgi:regulator of chromosome condensation